MWNDFKQQLQSNIRMRAGIAMMIAVVMGYFILDNQELINVAEKKKIKQEKSLHELRKQAKNQDWLARAASATASVTQLQKGDWLESTAGVAQAKWYDWLQSQLLAAGASNIKIVFDDGKSDALSVRNPQDVVENDRASLEPLNMMRAKIEFEAKAESITQLLSQIEQSERKMITETLVINRIGISRVQMTLASIYRQPIKDNASIDIPEVQQ